MITTSRFIIKCPKLAAFLPVFSSERFFFYDSCRNMDFHPVKSPYFCLGQQKKRKRTAPKELVKRTAILGYVKRLNIQLYSLDYENGMLCYAIDSTITRKNKIY